MEDINSQNDRVITFDDKSGKKIFERRTDTALSSFFSHERDVVLLTRSQGLAGWPRAFFFDFDATLVQQESLVELAAHAGKSAEISAMTEAAMAGQVDFATSLRSRLPLLRGVSEKIVNATVNKLVLNPGAEELIKVAMRRGAKIFIVSGGFTHIVEPIAKKLGVSAFRANQLEIKNECLTGQVKGSIVDGEEKARWMLEVCNQNQFDPIDCVAVGDGANDRFMMQKAGYSVGYRPKPILHPYLHASLERGDFRFLLEAWGW